MSTSSAKRPARDEAPPRTLNLSALLGICLLALSAALLCGTVLYFVFR